MSGMLIATALCGSSTLAALAFLPSPLIFFFSIAQKSKNRWKKKFEIKTKTILLRMSETIEGTRKQNKSTVLIPNTPHTIMPLQLRQKSEFGVTTLLTPPLNKGRLFFENSRKKEKKWILKRKLNCWNSQCYKNSTLVGPKVPCGGYLVRRARYLVFRDIFETRAIHHIN